MEKERNVNWHLITIIVLILNMALMCCMLNNIEDTIKYYGRESFYCREHNIKGRLKFIEEDMNRIDKNIQTLIEFYGKIIKN